MSRSIHVTTRDWEEFRRTDYSDSSRREEEFHRLFKRRHRKRTIKKEVREERTRAADPLPPIGCQAVPVRVRDECELIHFPAGVEDIVGVARFLPQGVLDGITLVDLCLGADDQGSMPGENDSEPDPFTGRLGYEQFPGAYGGRYLGTYWRSTAHIRLYAYVYKPDIRHRTVLEFYLKLQMLSTFVHEAAHHYDAIMRIGRGRWLFDARHKCERYAEDLQKEWATDCVVRYLEDAYPEQMKKLDAWMRYHAGVSASLRELAGDPRTTTENGDMGLVLIRPDVQGAFECLLADVINGNDATRTRLGFARQLHYAEDYVRALQIIDLVLADDMENLDAITLKADIFEHQGSYAQARKLAEFVVGRDETCENAWRVLADIYEATEEWRWLVKATTHLLDAGRLAKLPMAGKLLARARALLELGDLDGAAADLDSVDGVEWSSPHGAPPWLRKKAAELRDLHRERGDGPVRRKLKECR